MASNLIDEAIINSISEQHTINTQVDHIGCNVVLKSFRLHKASRKHNEIMALFRGMCWVK